MAEARSDLRRHRGGATVDLRILGTTDLHGQLHSYDYHSDREDLDLGLSRLAVLIEDARAETPNALLFDAGDFLQGAPMGDLFAYESTASPDADHPMMAAMNALDYDALTLGNHEFSYGLDFLMKVLGQAAMPVVSANILLDSQRHLVAPYALLQRQVTDRTGCAVALQIGVIGVAPPQTTLWEGDNLQGRVSMRDMVAAVAEAVPDLRQKGADLVVVLAHSGIGPARHAVNMENAVIPLAGIEGVDVILGGHTHRIFPAPQFEGVRGFDIAHGTICGTPVVMSGYRGSHLGVIDLNLVQGSTGWRVQRAKAGTRPCADASGKVALRPDRHRSVEAIAADAHKKVQAHLDKPVGRTMRAIDSFFVHLGHSPATALLAQVQQDHVARAIADTALASLPMLSSVSPCKAGGLGGPGNYTQIEAGHMTHRALVDIYVFPNKVAALRVSGAQILDWLERSASVFNRIVPGEADRPLTNSAFPAYNFEIIYGLEYEIDLSAPARFAADGEEVAREARRIRNLRWQGRPLDMATEFILCTNNFRAQGAGGFAGPRPDTIALPAPARIRDGLRAHVAAYSPLDINATSPFRLVAGQETSVILQTSPTARKYLDQIAGFRPEILGHDAHGFLCLRAHLGGRRS